MYKIVFIDIDGTLRNDKKEITERTKKAIKNAVNNGIYIVICSGRYRKFTEKISKEALASRYIINCNGGEVYDYNNNKIIYENNIPEKDVIELYNIANRNDVQYIINLKDKRVINHYNSNDDTDELNMPIEKFVLENATNQCVFIDNNLEKIQNVKNEIEKNDELKITNLSKDLVTNKHSTNKPLFFDVTQKNTSKGNGIKKLCEFLKIDLKYSVAIGDNYNDIPMFDVVRT